MCTTCIQHAVTGYTAHFYTCSFAEAAWLIARCWAWAQGPGRDPCGCCVSHQLDTSLLCKAAAWYRHHTTRRSGGCLRIYKPHRRHHSLLQRIPVFADCSDGDKVLQLLEGHVRIQQLLAQSQRSKELGGGAMAAVEAACRTVGYRQPHLGAMAGAGKGART
jgi:hypothetical protein